MDTTSTHPRHRPRNSTRAATRSRRDLPQREDDRHGTGSTPSTSTARAARRRQSWPQTPCCHGRPARAGRHKHARVETRDPGTDRRSPEAGGGITQRGPSKSSSESRGGGEGGGDAHSQHLWHSTQVSHWIHSSRENSSPQAVQITSG